MRTKLAAVAAGMLTFFGIALTTAPNASAHDAIAEVYNCNQTGSARCGYGGVTNNHTRVYSCDTYSDAVGFRTYYWLRNGASGYVDDANGSSSGCSAVSPGTASNPVTSFQGCSKKAVYVCSSRNPA